MNVMTQSHVKHTADQWKAATALLGTNAAPSGREHAWAEALSFLEISDHVDAHLIASVIAVDAGGLVLLARHRRYGRWGAIGGHVERGDASLSSAAARELLEETGLAAAVNPTPVDVLLFSYPCRMSSEPVPHLDVRFAAFVGTSTPGLTANDELMGLEWFNAVSLPTPLTPDSKEFVGLATAAVALRFLKTT
jgi:8-oxo-dGTP pyrophosphatase MutT (NUDIX family)